MFRILFKQIMTDTNNFEITIDEMVTLTKNRSINVHDIFNFISQQNDLSDYIIIPNNLLKKAFLMFSLYFIKFWKNVKTDTFDFQSILKTAYSLCHVTNFLSMLKEIFLHVNNICSSCFSLLKYMFVINSFGNSTCVLINNNIFIAMIEVCKKSYNTIHLIEGIKMIRLIKYVEHFAKTYNLKIESDNKPRKKQKVIIEEFIDV